MKSLSKIGCGAILALLLIGCGSFTAVIGGALSGLSGGDTVTLLNNGTDPITVSANGTFTFDITISSGDSYNVTVETQPAGETCTVANGAGTVGSQDITNVSVNCDAIGAIGGTVGGTITGLNPGKNVVMSDGTDLAVTVSANGAFVFPTILTAGIAYTVTIVTQPSGQTCTVANPSGTMAGGMSVTNVALSCS